MLFRSPHGIVRAITARLAPGSYLAVSHGTADRLEPGAAKAGRVAYDDASAPGTRVLRRRRPRPH